MPEFIDRSEGRRLFGRDPAAYGEVRPDYPPALYRFLRERGAIGPGTATLEIGAGPGLATRRLIELGAEPLTVVEPDPRFAASLAALSARSGRPLRVIGVAFEDAQLATAQFDLVAAATAFHWLDPDAALAKIADVLAPGGFVALWWNVLGDLDREDPFHDATQALLADCAVSPGGAPGAVPFALDRAARGAEFARCGAFGAVEYAEWRWQFSLGSEGIAKLYAGFSHIARMPSDARERLLAQLVDIAERRFGGRVERNVTSPIYLAQRHGS